MREVDHQLTEASPVAASPISGTERFASLDTLRGVAILGILVMNIYAFAMPFAAYSNPMAMGGTDYRNIAIWFFTHIFFDQKFLSIFAMLFGAGVVLIADHAEQRGVESVRLHYRRQLILLVLGALHAYLLWVGDILFAYAAVGMVVYPFRKLMPRMLIIIACLMLPITFAAMHGFSYVIEDMQVKAADYQARVAAGETLDEKQKKILERWDASRGFMAPEPEDLQVDIQAYRSGYPEIILYRAPVVLSMQQGMLLLFSWRIAALMFIGMALMKLGILSGRRPVNFYRRLTFAAYGLGLPLAVFSGFNLFVHDFDPIFAARYGMAANYFGSILVALGHIGSVMLVLKAGLWQRLMDRFAAVGRMALTNYLMHSLILTTVFYGYGLGLYAQLSRTSQMGLVIVVIAIQLLLSPWWLGRYRFGPVEWLSRSLTYWRRQPMRREIVI